MAPRSAGVVTPPVKGESMGVLNGTPEKRANMKTIPFEMVVRVCSMALNYVCGRGGAITSPTDPMLNGLISALFDVLET